MLAAMVWFMSQCERLGRKKLSPYFSQSRWTLHGILSFIILHLLGSYATTAFFLRSAENVMINWRSHYYWGHIACFIFYGIVSLLPSPPKEPHASSKRLDMPKLVALEKDKSDPLISKGSVKSSTETTKVANKET